MYLVLFMVLAYIMGSIPTGVLIGKKIKGIDIREHGSKNTGATNAYRVLGTKLGVIVLVADILKGSIPVLLAKLAGIEVRMLLLLGILTIIGHTFSFMLKFKGGKGVATSLGVFLILSPKAILLVVVIFIGVVFFSKYISLGSIIAAFSFPILVFVFRRGEWGLLIISILVASYVIYKHKANIKRLLEGNENKFNIKKG